LGLAKNILSARLKKLVARGIMEQVPASDGSAYQEYVLKYVLTKKGRELFPVIVALRQWGENYLFSRGEKRLQVVDKHPETRAQAGSAKRERGNPYGERSGTGYCDELNGRFAASNLVLTPGRKAP
jgi:hypothetical protein